MRVRAALLTGPGEPFRVEELDLDDPRPGEVRVRLAATGVCHSDHHLVTGATEHPMPCVAGHEGAGIVEAVGREAGRIREGDRVVLSWAPDCGRCFFCLRGEPHLCSAYAKTLWAGVFSDGETRLRFGGDPVYHYCGLAAFSERVVVPEESCVVIQDDVPLEIASLVGCAVATGVGAVTQTAGVRAGENVVIFGAGGVGLCAVMAAARSGASRVVVVDREAAARALARVFGATHDLAADADAISKIRQLTEGRGADWVFECIGVPDIQEAALGAVRPGGALVLVGLSPMGAKTHFSAAALIREEKTVQGSYYGSVNPQRDFPRFLDLYTRGELPLDSLITRRYGLEDINEAYAALLGGGVGRGVIVF